MSKETLLAYRPSYRWSYVTSAGQRKNQVAEGPSHTSDYAAIQRLDDDSDVTGSRV